MKRQRQNVRSKKMKISADDGNTELDKTLKKHDIMVKVIHAHTTMYTDQTGRFPVQSSRGNKLLMVLFEVDGNYIDAEPMKDSHETSLIKAYSTLWSWITKSGKVRPTVHILDNEASARFKETIRQNCDLQLVPPDTHRRNLAERAIQTFKSHFLAILAGVDPSFPMTLWDRLVPQAVITLNLLRQAKVDPTLSAYEFIHGKLDYNKMPLAPLGCAVQIHDSTNRRKTWDPHSLSGWYLGTSTEHYRCHIVFCTKTRAERISDTVFFQHRYLTQPVVTPVDMVMDSMNCNPSSRKAPTHGKKRRWTS